MRRTLGVGLVAPLLLVASACTAGEEATKAGADRGGSACDEVVAGIDAFNLGQYDETVRHFEAAVPLAEAQARDDDSQEAADLVDAVHYYADLPAEDYPDAARSSPEFAKYKAITLGQCVPVGSDVEDEPPGQLT